MNDDAKAQAKFGEDPAAELVPPLPRPRNTSGQAETRNRGARRRAEARMDGQSLCGLPHLLLLRLRTQAGRVGQSPLSGTTRTQYTSITLLFCLSGVPLMLYNATVSVDHAGLTGSGR